MLPSKSLINTSYRNFEEVKQRGQVSRSVREVPKPAAATNPSKRHRERLNGELETVAALLPYDQSVISRKTFI
uniref:BHLH domain-containing protein n=1 Tax=Parascaris equorum TaxID=6256 RepID=A0A914RY09_PAREQ